MTDYLKIFSINTDAFAVNKGFYFQNLVILRKWIQSYIDGDQKEIFVEVDDDVKEVGGGLRFTQIKCYSKNFSFKSEEIKKSLFNFFILYLVNKHEEGIMFHFHTNTGLTRSEKLLEAWMKDTNLDNSELYKTCCKKVCETLIAELNNQKKRKNNKGATSSQEIQSATNELRGKIKKEVGQFVKCISWKFLKEQQDESINETLKEVNSLLGNPKFQNRPKFILKDVFLSEIYRRSQDKDQNQRCLSYSIIDELLQKTEKELESHIDRRLIVLFGEFDEMKINVEKLTLTQSKHDKRISTLEANSGANNNFVPKKLTSVPLNFSKVYGRENCIAQLHELLDNHRVLNISGISGTGKTCLMLKYLKEHESQYDHIVWIDCNLPSNDILAYNEVLIQNLALIFGINDPIERRTLLIIEKLSKITGNNLLVLDNFNDSMFELGPLASLANWRIAITSRSQMEDFNDYKIPKLDYDSAKSLYYGALNKPIDVDEQLLNDFFVFVDYNPLAIKLCAKTISKSLDISLALIMKHANSRTLDDVELEINLKIEGSKQTQLFKCLQNSFELINLSGFDEYILKFLVLLPSEDIYIDELAAIGGPESYKVNKIHFVNSINNLHQFGWVERMGNQVRMSPLLQEIIRYEMKNQTNPYIDCMFFFIWLYHRIDEMTKFNPDKSFKYLKYAESILNTIKDDERASLEQPLILLEYALLNAYMITDKSDRIHQRLIKLKDSAEEHMEKDDVNLALIYNNLGLTYESINDYSNSIFFLRKGLNILMYSNVAISHSKTALNNLLGLYIKHDDVQNTMDLIREGVAFYQKSPEENDINISMFQHLIGIVFENMGKFEDAYKSYERAILYHLSLPVDQRNDMMLSGYYCAYAKLKLKEGKHQEMQLYLYKALEIIKDRNITDSNLINNIKDLIGISQKHLS